MKTNLFLFFFIVTIFFSSAQKYKFGKVSKTELREKKCPIDTTANACILYKGRKTFFEFDKDKGFIIKEEHFVRLKIYTKEGFEYATEEIPTYHTSFKREQVTYIKGYTYNLVNGKIIKTKLSKKNIYKEKTTDNITTVKFTMPNLKPGSVVEWKYTFYSPFITELNDVVLQYDIPAKKIHASIYIPEFFKYRPYQKGFLPINVQKSISSNSINVVQKSRDGTMLKETNFYYGSLDYVDNVQDIDMNNVPALRDEPYAGNINNYRSALLYELVSYKFPNTIRNDFAVSWEDVVNETYSSFKFGEQLKKRKYFKKDIETLKNISDPSQKLVAVFEFAKQKIKWNKKKDYLVDKGVVRAYKDGVGNVAEVNLNLINLLNAAGLEAYPVLVSTVKHGIPLFATRTGFNYVIAAVNLNGKRYLLDATDPLAQPNLLPERALNFQGRLIYKDGRSEIIPLFSNNFSSKITKINYTIKDDEITGFARSLMDNYYAYFYRKALKGQTSEENLKKSLQNKYENIDLIVTRVKNIDNLYKKIKETVKFETDEYLEEISGKIFVSPLLEWNFDENNPFKSKERKFPVFFNYPRIQALEITFTVPDDYEVISLPKANQYSFGNNEGSYNYSIEQKGNNIVIKTTYIINTPIVAPSSYQALRDFIDKILKKQQEKIVLKKKS